VAHDGGRARGSRRIDVTGLGEDVFSQGLPKRPFGDQIDLSPQQLGEFPLGREVLDEIYLGPRQKLDQQVDVAVGPQLAPRSRTEQGEFLDLVTAADGSDLRFGQNHTGRDGHGALLFYYRLSEANAHANAIFKLACKGGQTAGIMVVRPVRIRFLTSTPLDIRHGSGTYVGIHVLAKALERLGHAVEIETPRVRLPVYTLERFWFNGSLSPSRADLTVGFDMDGYRIAGSPSHVAALKGVIADEVRFESGLTRLTMSWQARCERLHVKRAARVLVTSRYSGERAREFYGLRELPAIVPEPIDLGEWRRLLELHPAHSSRFTVLFVGRLYRRKRVDVLLRAAVALGGRIPGLEVRIVGNGPCAPMLHWLARELKLEQTVVWLGDISRAGLLAEYNRADLLCLPSVQEGFGIVLLEAMAAGKPIVASRAAAIPEVAPHGVLVEPESPEALAAGMEALYRSPETRAALARAGAQWVEQFDAPQVARRFLEAVAGAATYTST